MRHVGDELDDLGESIGFLLALTFLILVSGLFALTWLTFEVIFLVRERQALASRRAHALRVERSRDGLPAGLPLGQVAVRFEKRLAVVARAFESTMARILLPTLAMYVGLLLSVMLPPFGIVVLVVALAFFAHGVFCFVQIRRRFSHEALRTWVE
jgi:hypothetical protein